MWTCVYVSETQSPPEIPSVDKSQAFFIDFAIEERKKRFNVKVIGENFMRCIVQCALMQKGSVVLAKKLSAFYWWRQYSQVGLCALPCCHFAIALCNRLDVGVRRTCANRNGKLDLQQSVIDCRLSIYCVRVFQVSSVHVTAASRKMHAIRTTGERVGMNVVARP